MKWNQKRVLVTGGTGFIGGAIVDMLLSKGAEVTVADKIHLESTDRLYKRKIERLDFIYAKHGLMPIFQLIDLATEPYRFQLLAEKQDIVFHLAAFFGGREFVNIRQVDSAKMLAVDYNVIDGCYRAGVERVHYASSACVYPDSLQKDRNYLLKEEDAMSTGEGFAGADNLYGWAKLMGELQCKVYHDEKDLKTSTCRYLTVYGEGELDASHAIAALTEKALDKQDPYEIWGSGKQERGFTYVSDTVDGSIKACELITDGTPINLGVDVRYNLDEVATLILYLCKHNPKEIKHLIDKPEGPFSRALDITRAKQMLDWTPKVSLNKGLRLTVDWHRKLREDYPHTGQPYSTIHSNGK